MAENPDVGGGTFTAVKPPALTGVKPECRGRGGASIDGTGVGTGPRLSCNDAFRAAEARIAGDAVPMAVGVPWCDLTGVGAGEGVYGPPLSISCC